MVYWVGFGYTDGNQQVDGIARVPGMMTEKKAQKLLKTDAAWMIPKEVSQEYEDKYRKINNIQEEEELEEIN